MTFRERYLLPATTAFGQVFHPFASPDNRMIVTSPLRLVPLLVATILLPGTALSQDTDVPSCSPGGPGPEWGPFAGLAQPAEAPHELLALIEIPAGASIKYELHEQSGRMEVDRFLSMPVAYPANYGVLPCTLAADGDALDVLVMTREPVAPGTLIRVRPVGLLRMLDRGEEDHKLLAVPVDGVDPGFARVRELDDLPRQELDRIEAFFRVYKNLPDPHMEVVVGPWEGLHRALETIHASMDSFRAP